MKMYCGQQETSRLEALDDVLQFAEEDVGVVRLEYQRRPQPDRSLPAPARVHAEAPQPRQHLHQSEVRTVVT